VAVIEGGTSGALQEVGVPTTGIGPNLSSANHLKALPYGSLGHYVTTVRVAIVISQAANSRLFSIRNTGTNLLVVTRLRVNWIQTAAHTTTIEDSLDLYRVTGFSAQDATNTVTPTVSPRRTTMAAAPGGAQVRHVTVAGAAAGMTGGTLTKDTNMAWTVPLLLQATQPTASMNAAEGDFMSDAGQDHPFVLAQNEGLIIENRVALGAAAGSSVYIHCGWTEATNY
jgi:hypothetical protein